MDTTVFLSAPSDDWFPAMPDAIIASAQPVTKAVAIPEYPGFYQRLFHELVGTLVTWYLLTYKLSEDGNDSSHFVTYKQGRVDQPSFPAVFGA